MSDVINAHDLGVAGGYIIEAAMQGDIDQLKAENDRLQNDADLLRAMLSQVQTEKRCYMAENAKLRGLLEAVLQCAGETKRDKGCDACPMYNGPWRNDGTWCLLRPTLRELGVEVDG